MCGVARCGVVCGVCTAVMIDKLWSVRVMVRKDSGPVGAITRITPLKPFQLSFSHPFASLTLPPFNDASDTLLLTRKSNTAIYTTYQPNAHNATPASTAYRNEVTEISFDNHCVGRWGPFIIRRTPDISTTPVDSTATLPIDQFQPTVMSLIADYPTHNPARILTPEMLSAIFIAISKRAVTSTPQPLSSTLTVADIPSPVVSSETSSSALVTTNAGRIIQLIVDYTVLYPLIIPFDVDGPFYCYFDQRAVCRQSTRCPLTVSIERLNAGQRGSSVNLEGTIRLRLSPDSSMVGTVDPTQSVTVDVIPSVTFGDGLSNTQTVTVGGKEINAVVSSVYYQNIGSISVENTLYVYPYLKLQIAPNDRDIKRMIEIDAAEAANAAAKAKAEADAAAAANERPVITASNERAPRTAQSSSSAVSVDEDDEMAAFRKKKNVNKKEAKEIDLMLKGLIAAATDI